MKPVKIAQIGLEHDHSLQTLHSMCKQSDCFEVVGVWETHGLQRQDRPFGVPNVSLEDLLNMPDLEAVTIETAELEATKYALMFAERGVAVHLDKPGSPDLDAFRSLIDLVLQKNIAFQMGYMYRYNPLFKQTLEMVRSGKLGSIFSVEAQMSVHHPAEKRQWLSRFPGGMMFYLGCHLIDLVLQLQGMPEEIIPLNCSTRSDGITAQDYGFAIMRYANGISFVKTCASEYNGFDRRQLVVCGSKGTIEIHPLEIKLGEDDDLKFSKGKITLQQDHPNDWKDSSNPMDEVPYNRYDNMMRAFARQIRHLEQNPYTPEYEYKLFQTLLCCCGKDV